MIVKLLTERHLEFLGLKGGCRGLSQSTHVKMPHCWKSHATANLELNAHADITIGTRGQMYGLSLYPHLCVEHASI